MKSKAERDQAIQKRAYQIWEEEGKLHGKDKEHWERACMIIETIEILEHHRAYCSMQYSLC